MKIGFDIDDTLADFDGPLINWYNRNFGTNFTHEGHYTYNLLEIWGLDRRETKRRLDLFYQSKDFVGILPMRHAVETVNYFFGNGNELHIISGRFPEGHDETKRWIQRNFPSKFKGIHFVDSYNSEIKVTKAHICDQLGIDIMIDDALDYVADCAINGRKVYLLDKPWNQVEIPKDIIRVSNLKEIMEIESNDYMP